MQKKHHVSLKRFDCVLLVLLKRSDMHHPPKIARFPSFLKGSSYCQTGKKTFWVAHFRPFLQYICSASKSQGERGHLGNRRHLNSNVDYVEGMCGVAAASDRYMVVQAVIVVEEAGCIVTRVREDQIYSVSITGHLHSKQAPCLDIESLDLFLPPNLDPLLTDD